MIDQYTYSCNNPLIAKMANAERIARWKVTAKQME
jgi:hypothetical protein